MASDTRTEILDAAERWFRCADSTRSSYADIASGST